MKIIKGDTVKIISGKDRGKTGKIFTRCQSVGKVIVDGLNLFKKQCASKKQGEKGTDDSVPRPLGISKVMLVCSSCKT